MRLTVIGSIFLCLSLATGCIKSEETLDQIEIVNPDTTRTVKDVSVPALLARCTQQIEEWSAITFDILNNILDYKNYWQEQQLSPSRYFWRKNPLKWFSEKPQECEIAENITFLEKEISSLSTEIGTILLKNNILKNIPEEKKLSAILTISIEISNHLNSRLFPLNAYKPLGKDLLPEQILEVMNNNIAHYAHYKKVSLLRLDPYKGPGHFTSNWINYSLAGIGLLAAGKLWQINHQHIINKIKHGSTAAQHFYSDYVKKSFKNWWDKVYYRNRKPLGTPESRQTNRDILEGVLFQHLAANNTNNQPVEELKKIAHDAAMTKDFECIKKDLIEVTDNLYYNMTFHPSKTARLAHFSYTEFRSEVDDLKFAFDELNVHLDYLMAPMVGFILLGCSFLSYKIFSAITYDIYGLISPHKIWVYRPIQRALIEIEAILNRYNNGQNLPLSEQGLVHYWLYKISQSIKHIPHHHQLNFNRDVGELASYEFSIPQKISIINRMQRSYSFLMPYIK